jgi:hypothetical protein
MRKCVRHKNNLEEKSIQDHVKILIERLDSVWIFLYEGILVGAEKVEAHLSLFLCQPLLFGNCHL